MLCLISESLFAARCYPDNIAEQNGEKIEMDPRKTFSRSARRYLKSTDHRSGPDLDLIREIASEIMPSLTLDVATGVGHAVRSAAPFSARCAVLDVTMEMLSVAGEHLAGVGLEHVNYIVGSAESLPIRDRCVDLLCCRIACHHFRDLPSFLAGVNRVLTVKGRFVIIDSIVPDERESDTFMNRVERLRDPSHVRSRTLAQWRSLLADSGLSVDREKIFERKHPFREWVDRVGLPEVRRQLLEDSFRSAPDGVKEKFRIELDAEGKILSYTDEKVIFAGAVL